MRPDRRWRVWIGWDQNEVLANEVAAKSLQATSRLPVDICKIDFRPLQDLGVYLRDTESRGDRYWDVISEAPMTTGHAIARFFVPWLANHDGWALFTDGDVLFREDIAGLLLYADPFKAVQVVQHAPMPEAGQKKDGMAQTQYARKNWSSVMLFNCAHPAHRILTDGDPARWPLNAWPGRDLHAFKWLKDDLIGELPASWNYLSGVTDPKPEMVSLVHFTMGTPNLPGHEHDEFADEWLRVAGKVGVPDLAMAQVNA